MGKIAKNIRHLRMLNGWSQEQFAQKLGISRARVGSYEESRCEPPIALLIRMSEFFHVAIDALVRSDLSKVRPEELMKVGANRLLFPITVDEAGNDLVEVVPVKAYAGYLNGYADPEYVEGLQRMKLPFLPVGKHRAFPIKGDSMLPVKEGSYVVARFVESLSDIRDGRTYVLLTRNEGLVYKRVYSNIKKDKTLMLHSDNKIYQPYKVKAEDILEVWEFTCCLNTSEVREEELNVSSIMQMLRGLQVEMERLKR
ncbi:MAG: LexA family transcriptional regulator [Bacteroidota bacterium]